MKIAVGIDIGGTNTVWGFVSPSGEVIHKDSFPTSSCIKAIDFVDKMTVEIKYALAQNPNYEILGIGIGAPNGNYFKGTIEHPPNLSWKGITPIRDMFQDNFDLPVILTNDANAAALGEMQFGAAKGMKDFVVITLGTGLGSGFVANGSLLYGHDGFAGELGHTIIEPDGRQCGCGRKGCLETYVSASGIVKTAKLLLEQNNVDTSLKKYKEITSKVIAVCASEGDELSLKIFDMTAKKLGLSLANTVVINSPEAIILFGGLAKSGSLILEPTIRYFEEYCLNLFKKKVKILLSEVPEAHAAVLGSAALILKARNFYPFF